MSIRATRLPRRAPVALAALAAVALMATSAAPASAQGAGSPGIGSILDGWGNRDMDIGAFSSSRSRRSTCCGRSSRWVTPAIRAPHTLRRPGRRWSISPSSCPPSPSPSSTGWGSSRSLGRSHPEPVE